MVQLIVRYKSSSKCTCSWYYKETVISESSTMKVVHEKIDSTSYECRLEIKEPDEKTAGMYKCLVSNEKGEINANLMLNVQMAQRFGFCVLNFSLNPLRFSLTIETDT